VQDSLNESLLSCARLFHPASPLGTTKALVHVWWFDWTTIWD